jgi:hypothetical protein
MSAVPFIFANQVGPIPLSELDVNFANVKLFADTAGYVTANAQANITSVGALVALSVTGNILTNGQISATGNITSGNVLTSGIVSATNTVTGGNVLTGGLISATGNITGGNISTVGIINTARLTGTGNIRGGNILTNGLISATGNITGGNILTPGSISVAGSILAGLDVTVNGNIVILGNATVEGTTTTINSNTVSVNDLSITVANNVSTSFLINNAGIDAGYPTVAYIRYTDASKGWTTANNFSIGGNISAANNATITNNLSAGGNATITNNVSIGGNVSVTGTGAFTKVLTAPTATTGISNTQVATTEFVGTAIYNATSNLGTMATQNFNSVNITGGTISGLGTPLAAASGGTGLSSSGTSGNILISNGSGWTTTALNGAIKGLGFGGETWQNLTGSRAVDITYTNNETYPIQIIVSTVNTNGTWLYINGSIVTRQWYDVNTGAGQVGYGSVTAIIPPGSTYLVTAGNLYTWYELR